MASAGTRHRREAPARKSFLHWARVRASMPSSTASQILLSSKHMDLSPSSLDAKLIEEHYQRRQKELARSWLITDTTRSLRGLPRLRHARHARRRRERVRNIDYSAVAKFADTDHQSTNWVDVFNAHDKP